MSDGGIWFNGRYIPKSDLTHLMQGHNIVHTKTGIWVDDMYFTYYELDAIKRFLLKVVSSNTNKPIITGNGVYYGSKMYHPVESRLPPDLMRKKVKFFSFMDALGLPASSIEYITLLIKDRIRDRAEYKLHNRPHN